jgi:hypothetical protein
MPKEQHSEKEPSRSNEKDQKNSGTQDNHDDAKIEVKRTEDVTLIWKKSSLYMPQGLVVSSPQKRAAVHTNTEEEARRLSSVCNRYNIAQSCVCEQAI